MIRERLRRAGDDDEGQSLVEYALILVLVTVTLIVIVSVVARQTNNLYSNLEIGMQGATH